ncbi:MAG: imidazolonepropionase [Armatimonadetes bacterium]|nr:imidazolonepropionase [Armatimonadota bacterium]
MSSLAILNIGQLVSLIGPNRGRVGQEMSDLGLIYGAGILVQDDRIRAVGPSEDIALEMPADAVIIDAGGRVVTPGFVDAHTHLVFGGNRCQEFELRSQGATYQEISSKGGGIHSSVEATRSVDEESLLARSQKWAHKLIQMGTTTAEIKSGYGLNADSEFKMLRVIRDLRRTTPLRTVGTLLAAHAIPKDQDKDDYLKHITTHMIPEASCSGLARYVDIFVEENYYSAECARKIAGAAKKHGLGLRMHVDQMRDGHGAALAAELGAITADHLEQTSPAGIGAMKAANTIPVLLPTSVFGLRHEKYPVARAMIDAGLPVVLATDFNPGSSPSPSMPFAMSLAMLNMGMSAAECLTAATINAAASLELAHELGSLEPGKVADIVIHEWEDYREIPYWIATPGVRTTICRGQKFDKVS